MYGFSKSSFIFIFNGICAELFKEWIATGALNKENRKPFQRK